MVQNNPFTWQSQAGKKKSRERNNQLHTCTWKRLVTLTVTADKVRRKKWNRNNFLSFFFLFFFFFFFFFHAEKKVGGNNMPNTHIQHLLADTCACTPTVLLHVHKHSNYIYMCTCTLPYMHMYVHKVSLQHFSKREANALMTHFKRLDTKDQTHKIPPPKKVTFPIVTQKELPDFYIG